MNYAHQITRHLRWKYMLVIFKDNYVLHFLFSGKRSRQNLYSERKCENHIRSQKTLTPMPPICLICHWSEIKGDWNHQGTFKNRLVPGLTPDSQSGGPEFPVESWLAGVCSPVSRGHSECSPRPLQHWDSGLSPLVCAFDFASDVILLGRDLHKPTGP